MTLLRQEIDHPKSSFSSSTSPPMTSSTVSSKSVDWQEWGDPYGMGHDSAAVSSKHVERHKRGPLLFWNIRRVVEQTNKNPSTVRPVVFWKPGMAARIQGKFGGWWNSIAGRLSRQFFSRSFFRAQACVRRYVCSIVSTGLDEKWWADSMECNTYLRNIQDLFSGGKTPHERRFRKPFEGPIIPFGSLVEYCPISAKDQSRILRTSTLLRQRPIRGESCPDFLGESEGSFPPPPQDSLPDAGWSDQWFLVHVTKLHTPPSRRTQSQALLAERRIIPYSTWNTLMYPEQLTRFWMSSKRSASMIIGTSMGLETCLISGQVSLSSFSLKENLQTWSG